MKKTFPENKKSNALVSSFLVALVLYIIKTSKGDDGSILKKNKSDKEKENREYLDQRGIISQPEKIPTSQKLNRLKEILILEPSFTLGSSFLVPLAHDYNKIMLGRKEYKIEHDEAKLRDSRPLKIDEESLNLLKSIAESLNKSKDDLLHFGTAIKGFDWNNFLKDILILKESGSSIAYILIPDSRIGISNSLHLIMRQAGIPYSVSRPSDGDIISLSLEKWIQNSFGSKSLKPK